MGSSPEQVLPAAKPVAPPGTDEFEQFLTVLAATFEHTEMTFMFLTEVDNTPPPYPSTSIDRGRIRRYIEPGIRSIAENGGILLQAGDMSAVAVWEPPGFRGKAFSDQVITAGPIRRHWTEAVRALKEEYLGIKLPETGAVTLRPHYHLGFLGRNPDIPSVPGAISALVKPFLDQARQEGVPAWLEATDAYAVSIYEHYGFRLVKKVIIGAGKRNPQGWPEEGGAGVPGHPMIFDSHLQN